MFPSTILGEVSKKYKNDTGTCALVKTTKQITIMQGFWLNSRVGRDLDTM